MVRNVAAYPVTSEEVLETLDMAIHDASHTPNGQILVGGMQPSILDAIKQLLTDDPNTMEVLLSRLKP